MSDAPHGALPWTPWEAVVFGWSRLRADPRGVFVPLFVGVTLAYGGVVVANLAIGPPPLPGEPGDPRRGLYRFLAMYANLPVASFMLGGVWRFALKVARGAPYAFADVFSGGSTFAPMLGVGLIVTTASLLGLVACVVPGIVVLVATSFAQQIVVDRRASAFEAVKASVALTEGHRLAIFGFGLLAVVLSLLGYAACLVGTWVAGSVSVIGLAWIYLRLTGEPGGNPQSSA